MNEDRPEIVSAGEGDLIRRIRELEATNTALSRSQRALLNALEDAVDSRHLADRLNMMLRTENGERHRAQETMRESEQRSQTLISNLPGGAVFILDGDLRYVLAEGEALHDVGLESADLLGKTMTEVMPSQQARESEALYRRALAGEAFTHELALAGRWFLSRGVPLRNPAGAIEAVMVLAFNITARREAEESLRQSKLQLEEALAAAQAAHRVKDQFIATLSHELRTPLTPVLIAAGLGAENHDFSPEVRALFQDIRNHVQLEARLIEDLLAETEVGRGQVKMARQTVDAHVILHDALRTVQPDFARRQIKPVLDLQARHSLLHADPIRLQQVFWNVLRNAAKFSPEGGTVRVSTANPGNDRIAIAVTDDGIGLTPEEIATVFDPFTQGDHAKEQSDQAFGGLGLGLAISKRLTKHHGGSIEAASPGRGQGATFTVTLPLREKAADPAAGGSKPSSAARQAARVRQALVVEDHTPTRGALKALLRLRGYEVTAAESVRAALAVSPDRRFDVLLCDLGLKDGTGYDVIRQFHERQPDLPAVAISGFGRRADVDQTRAAGFQAHITKPISVEQVDQVLAKVARLARRKPAGRDRQEARAKRPGLPRRKTGDQFTLAEPTRNGLPASASSPANSNSSLPSGPQP